MKRRFPPLDFDAIRTIPLGDRENKVTVGDLAAPVRAGMRVSELLAGLPNQLAGAELRSFVSDVASAVRGGGVVIAMIGGHVIKVGLAPILIQLMEAGVVHALAMNGSASIHDFELALVGGTSEDVSETLETGEFGMAEETGRLMNEAVARDPAAGMGAALGRMIDDEDFPHADVSVLAAAHRLGVPATVHVAIGTDIIHQHPAADGARIGEATYADFQRFASVVAELDGGAVLNIGSAVIMPEVFLKALTIARNLGRGATDFVAADFDMTRHYRPGENVVARPTSRGGRGYRFTG
ncbi:hypothetical protein HN766_09890, partial [Candidatus Poribacteria bacterium]|nr:hypothetical protein [Candidatus Poribacteria bacterium]